MYRTIRFMVRSIALAALAVPVAGLVSSPVTAFGQEAPGAGSSSSVEGVQQAAVTFQGRILGNQVTIRSGPSENYYPVTRLDAGALVVVNGNKADWLRISSPEGTFSLISKSFVEVTGNTARVVRDNVNVRAGSLLNVQYATVQTKLMRGDALEVLGEVETRDGVFIKIKPPPGAYLYVKGDFVAPVRSLGAMPAAAERPKSKPAEPVTGAMTTRPSQTAGSPPVPSGNEAFGGGMAGDSKLITPGPNGTSGTGTSEAPAPTQQAPTQQELARATAQERAERLYDEADRSWQENMNKPIEEQPLPELLAKFEALAANDDLPITLRQQAISTAGFVRARNGSREELLKLRQQQADMQARLQPMQSQNQQLAERFRQIELTTYTAVGKLQTTTLQEGGYNLLRLVDPATGHTLVYLRSTDASMVGNFVGVKGKIVRDEKLNVRVIAPTSVVLVDAGSVGRGISAEIMPASLRPAPTTPTSPAAVPSTQPVP